jgi:recombination protein RecA
MANSEITKLLGVINKKFGEDTANFLTENFVPKVITVSTGSLTLDLALGRGGFPTGRLIEVYGPSMSGKTTICFFHIAQVQRDEAAKAQADPSYSERYPVFVDAEHAFDPKLAKEYGVDLDRLIYINPKTAENAIDAMDALIRSGNVACIVVDSVSSLVPTKIVESSIEQQTMGLLARFMSTVCQKLTGIAYAYDTTIIFINQIREKIGGYAPNGATPETTSGGRALPFYASVRLNVRMGDKLKTGNDIFGHVVKVKVTKNKVGIPFKEAAFPLIYGHGVDRADEISQLSVIGGVIRQAGAWFRYEVNGELVSREGVELKWQGREKFSEYIRNNPFFMMELEDRLRGVEIEAPDGAPEDEDGYAINSDEGIIEAEIAVTVEA